MSAWSRESINTIKSVPVEKGKNEGGRVLTGGGSDGEQGFFIEPTVLQNVKPEHNRTGKIFGPVLAWAQSSGL